MEPLQNLAYSQRQNTGSGTRVRSLQQKENRLSGVVHDQPAVGASKGHLRDHTTIQSNPQALVQRPDAAPPAELLQPEQISALYQQCIKLATENKITSKNTWALGLIDHLHDLVQPNDSEGNTTNFQRASVTLGAGVEIYAKRVDSVHTEAYKVMGGLSRGGAAALTEDGETQEECDLDPEEAGRDQAKGTRRAAMLRDVNPSSTLEPSFEALNVKKFDIAFTVDPLFHKMSAQFDEGGARGLLLNNLSVYDGCEILFASHKIPSVPGDQPSSEPEDVMVDLAPIGSHVKKAVDAMNNDAVICPAMEELRSLLGPSSSSSQEQEDFAQLIEMLPDMGRPTLDSGARSSALDTGIGTGFREEDDLTGSQAEGLANALNEDAVHGLGRDLEGTEDAEQPQWMTQEQFQTQQDGDLNFAPATYSDAGDDLYDHGEADDFNEDELGNSSADPSQQQTQEANGNDAVSWLVSGMENLNLDGKAWAGAGHWRFRTRQNPNADPELADAPSKPAPRTSSRKKGEPLDFNNLPELPPEALAIADPKDITLKSWGTKAPTLLPEDLHYKASSLAELFLLPGVPILGGRSRGQQGPSTSQDAAPGYSDDYEDAGGEMWDNDDHGADSLEEGTSTWGPSSGLGGEDLIDAPRKVAQIGINYARASKQVDVRALKRTLWHTIGDLHDSQGAIQQDEDLSFQDVLAGLSEDNVSDSVSDLSVHLCFICVLHLANENGLRITGTPSLDRLTISDVPTASTV